MDVSAAALLTPSSYTAGALVKRFGDYVLRLAWLWGARGDEIEEVGQLLWLWVVENPTKIEPNERQVKILLARESRRLWRQGKRRRHRGDLEPDTFFEELNGTTDSCFEEQFPGSTRAPDSGTRATQNWEQIRQWIDNADHFQAFALRAVYGWTCEDVAQFQGTSVDCTYKRLERVRVLLTEKLGKRDRAVLPVLSIPTSLDELIDQLRREPVLPAERVPTWDERVQRITRPRPRPLNTPKRATWAMSVMTAVLVSGPSSGSVRVPTSDTFDIRRDPSVMVATAPVPVPVPVVPATATTAKTPGVKRSLPATTSLSKLLVLQMGALRRSGKYREALLLVEEHERRFGAEDAGAREQERRLAAKF